MSDRIRIRAELADRSRFVLIEAEGDQAVSAAAKFAAILLGDRPQLPAPKTDKKPRRVR